MNLDQLTYIVELEKSKTLSQAARNLNISQPGLSQSIDQLEKELGVTLFERSRHGTQITEEGYVIVKQAKEVLNEVYKLHQEAKKLRLPEQVPFRIAVTNEITVSILHTLIEFQLKYQEFKVEIIEAVSHDIIQGVKADLYDIGFIVTNQEKFASLGELTFTKVTTGELKLYVWKEHYLAKQSDPIPIEILKEQEFVLFRDEYIDEFVQRFQKLYGNLNISFRTTSLSAAVEVMRAFQAVCLVRNVQMSTNILKISSQDMVEKSLKHVDDIIYTYGWITKKGKRLKAIESLLIKKISDSYKD